MTTPVPSTPVGPLYRSLLEALESVAARDQVRALLRTSLLHARLEVVPEEPELFRRFVEGALTIGLERTLGTGAAEMVLEQLSHVLRMIAPAVRRQATGTGDDESDDPSGEYSLEASVPSAKSSGPALRGRPELTAALRAPDLDRSSALEAPILFPPRATSHESGTQRKRPPAVSPAPRSSPVAIARVSSPSIRTRATQPDGSFGASGASSEVQAPRSGPRALATDVLVVSLDPQLAPEVEGRLLGRSRIASVTTLAELMSALGRLAGARVAIVLDTGVPAIDLPTFASLAPALPPGAFVVLWGTDERQKGRLEAIFPQARAWVASGNAESAADLLLDE